MSLRMCVLLWARDGMAEAVHAYEDGVLALLDRHGGRLVSRDTVAGRDETEPVEVQIIEFPGQGALDAYLADPLRAGREAERAAAIARTQILDLA